MPGSSKKPSSNSVEINLENRLKQILTVMDSMNNGGKKFRCFFKNEMFKCVIIYILILLLIHITELDHKDGTQLFTKEPSRIVRIARGAGVTELEAQNVIASCARFANIVKKMGGKKGHKSDMARNLNSPFQMKKFQNSMSKVTDPRILKHTGMFLPLNILQSLICEWISTKS